MYSRRIVRGIYGSTVMALLLGLFSMPVLAQNTDSEEINRLLKDAKVQAVEAEYDADQLVSYTRSGVSWESHSVQLSRMKDDVNALGKLDKQLRDSRASGSPWQQAAIDRTTPLLQEMADTLTATINHLNDHRNELKMQKYRDYADANYELASRMSSMISDFVDYGQAKSRVADIEQKLELPTPAGGGDQ